MPIPFPGVFLIDMGGFGGCPALVVDEPFIGDEERKDCSAPPLAGD